MANVYVRSGAGGAATGADWANAYLTLGAALTAKAAGDDFWVSEDHAESTAGAVTLTSPGSISNACRIICVNHAGSVPPVSADLATTATVSTTGANSITFAGYAECYGVAFQAGSAANNGQLLVSPPRWIFYSCGLTVNNTNASGGIYLGSSNGALSDCDFWNCTLTFGAAGQGINPRGGRHRFFGGSLGGATFPTTFYGGLSGTQQPTDMYFDGFDFTNLSGKTIVGAMSGNGNYTQILNGKLPASVTVAATRTSADIVDLIVSDSGSGVTRQERYMYGGPLTTETTIVRSGGASDGTTPISWKVVANANNKKLMATETFVIAEWNTATGSAKTATVEIVNDGTTLTNAEVELIVEYLGNASQPICSFVSSGPADFLAAASNLSTSSVTWTTTGLASPVKQYLQVSFTPQLAGPVRATVKIRKASKTIYIDPKLTIA